MNRGALVIAIALIALILFARAFAPGYKRLQQEKNLLAAKERQYNELKQKQSDAEASLQRVNDPEVIKEKAQEAGYVPPGEKPAIIDR
ncbi:MAG: septum formation initiator family protein [Armatimonadetes bacterium]|nr:septum formation initiator family protein [Armatimonadota bacterium]